MGKTIDALVLCLALTFPATAAQNPSPQTASESFADFIDAYKNFEEGLFASWRGVEIDPDEAVPMDTLAMMEGKFRPLMNLGVSKKSMENDKKSSGWTEVLYSERGNDFTITCVNGNGSKNIYEGTYEPESGALFCKVRDGGPDVYAEYWLEYRKTDWGYAAQVYDPSNEAVHRLTTNGGEGAVGWGDAKRFDPLTGREPLDYPKGLTTYYAFAKGHFAFKPWNGPVREYKR